MNNIIAILYCEFKKMFFSKIVRLSLILHCIMIFLMAFVCINNADSPYYICLRGLLNTLNFMEGTLIIALFGYVLGIEYEMKTIKILKAKNIKPYKVIGAKTIVGIMYIFIYIILAFVITLIVGKMAISTYNDIDINFNNNHFVIQNSEALKFMINFYIAQGIAFIYILSVSILFNILTKNTVISVISTFVFIQVSSMVGMLLKRIPLPNVYKFIPINSDYIWRDYAIGEVNQRLICLLIFSLLIYILNIKVYKEQNIK